MRHRGQVHCDTAVRCYSCPCPQVCIPRERFIEKRKAKNMLAHRIDELIGNTPLLELCNIEKEENLSGKLYAKLEFLNPTGSAKDRPAREILDDYERCGVLKPGGVVVEATSGNTGIGLASVAAARGYKAIIIMPDTMSSERIKLMKAYGAEVVLSDGKKGMAGSLEKLKEIREKYPDAVEAGQFVNASNALAHYKTTGPELWKDTEGGIDIFVAGVGTGGTLTGCAMYLKEKSNKVKIVAVEPAKSPLLSKGTFGPHGLQGIGANFVPEVLKRELIDEIVCITEEEAFEGSRRLGRREGIMVGITSGAAFAAALKEAKKPENKGKSIVFVTPDSGDRYLSSELFG